MPNWIQLNLFTGEPIAPPVHPKRRNLLAPPPKNLPVCEIIKRYRGGESLQVIADDYGVSWGTIRNRLLKAGEPIRTRYESRQLQIFEWFDAVNLVDLYVNGNSRNEFSTLRELGSDFGFSWTTIKKYLLARGVKIRTSYETEQLTKGRN